MSATAAKATFVPPVVSAILLNPPPDFPYRTVIVLSALELKSEPSFVRTASGNPSLFRSVTTTHPLLFRLLNDNGVWTLNRPVGVTRSSNGSHRSRTVCGGRRRRAGGALVRYCGAMTRAPGLRRPR